MEPISAKSVDQASARDEILRKLRERMVGFAASRMQRDAAEDLAQEVLILLHEKYGHLDRLEDLLPLALKIIRFKLLAYCRKARRHGEYGQVSVDEVQTPDGAEDALPAMEQHVDHCGAANQVER
jgi:RNA polymerase sigma-70 factor (ECF subfamily)